MALEIPMALIGYAAWDLLQRRRRKDVVHSSHRTVNCLTIADVADVEFDLRILKFMPHVVLLFLVARENADFFDIGIQEATQHSVAERPGSTGNEKRFTFEHRKTYM